MRTALAGLAITTTIAFAVALAGSGAGIWPQERATSMASRPRGLRAANASCLLGLHAQLPERTAAPVARSRHAGGESPLVPDQNELAAP